MRRLGWRILATLVGFGFKLCPRQWRFPLAQRFARVFQSLLRRTSQYTNRDTQLDGYCEEALRLTLYTMKRLDVEYDPHITVLGAEAIKRGSLIISLHFYLNPLFVRWLMDAGYQVSQVAASIPDQPKYAGSQLPGDALKSDAKVFFGIRRRVAAGGVVVIYLDHPRPLNNGRIVETPVGPRYVSDAALKFAERFQIPVLFCSTRMTEQGQIVTRVIRPSSHHAAGLLDEYCNFVSAEARQVER
ncbi:MAG TPA: hypothetical protein VEF04_08795 [Blastocatellia bacterium]|nr:hypothetical protein [Blastocatellia bacterium]